MGQKTDSLSSKALILAIEGSLGEFWGNWGRASQSELYDGQDFIRCYTGVPFAFCNGVICRQFSPSDVGAAVDYVVLQSSHMGCTVYRGLGFQELSILRGYSPA